MTTPSTPSIPPRPELHGALGIDVSNHTGHLPPDYLEGSNFRFLIAGTYDIAIAQSQLQAALVKGMAVGVYSYLYFDGRDEERMERALECILPFGEELRDPTRPVLPALIWLDVEEGERKEDEDFDASPVISTLQMASQLCEERGVSWGVYSSYYKWHNLTANSRLFSHVPLWDARYDGVPTMDYWTPYGGWNTPAVKQFQGDVMVGGMRVDLNVVF